MHSLPRAFHKIFLASPKYPWELKCHFSQSALKTTCGRSNQARPGAARLQHRQVRDPLSPHRGLCCSFPNNSVQL